MAYDIYTMNGIVLDVYNHKEWDKKFVFFSKEFGIINIVGIGLQRPKSKLRSYITRFCNISVDVVHGKTGYRLVRAVSNNQGFFLYKKEAYFILNKTTKLIQELLDKGINIHYVSNITGHGLRKLMRARGNFTYVVEKLFDPQEVFKFIQENAKNAELDV